MVDDSDVDSWYDWRRGDDTINDVCGKNFGSRRNPQSVSFDSMPNFAFDGSQEGCSRSNGMGRYETVPSTARSGTEVRFINPAIYAETLNNEEVDHDVKIRVKVSSTDRGPINCGDSANVNAMSALRISNDLGTSYMDHAGDQGSVQETYRCYSFNTPPMTASTCGIVRSKSVISCNPSNRVERRCKIVDGSRNDDELSSTVQTDSEIQRYTFNGHRIVQASSSSLSSIRISGNRSSESEIAKKISYTDWVRKKQEEERQKKEVENEAERKKQETAERLAREKEERDSRERDNFLKWSERKKKEIERKKAVVEKELELQRQLKEIEDKAAVVKTLYLRQWERKKKEAEKVRQKKEEMKQKQREEEKKKRLEDSVKAYENWRKMAKNKPKPATQGLLPHQKAKPTYVNPTPWQRIIDDDEEENAVEDQSNVGRKTQSQMKISARRSAYN